MIARRRNLGSVRIVLDQNDFKTLVSGHVAEGVATTEDGNISIKVILSDIGWKAMLDTVMEAMDGENHATEQSGGTTRSEATGGGA